MISSMMLLIAFQVFWLRGLYKNAFFDFRREANISFRVTVLTMRDSLLSKNIRKISEETAPEADTFTIKKDSVHIRHDVTVNSRMESSTVQVFIRNKDAGQKNIKEGPTRIQSKQFVMQLFADSINLDTLYLHTQKAFQEAGIENSFFIEANRDPEPGQMDFYGIPPQMLLKSFPGNPEDSLQAISDTVKTEPVRVNPMSTYTASIVGVKSSVLQGITPQILFSILLTLMIAVAFFVMYRNLAAQQKVMELKNDFISNVTHELKTPIATVSVALEALKNFKALNDQKLTEEYLEIAQRELDRLTIMTDKILKTSIFESKGIVFTPELTDFNELMNAVLESNKAIFEKCDANVTVTRSGSSFEISGSAAHLTSVINNLVDNALKYSTGKPLILIHLAENEKEITFTIRDHGIGISPEYQRKIFEKFFRVPTGNIHTIKGYGLGLSYVASVIKSHHGKIEVDSDGASGSTFKVTLPKMT